MDMFRLAGRFVQEEDGAVTVDWVILTAGVVGLVAIAMAGLRGNMQSVGSKVQENLANMTINTSF
jgi:Flp pilus assembly pilin Flp